MEKEFNLFSPLPTFALSSGGKKLHRKIWYFNLRDEKEKIWLRGGFQLHETLLRKFNSQRRQMFWQWNRIRREKGGKSFSQASGWPACDALNWRRFEAPRRAIHQIVESLSQLLDCFCRHQIKFEHDGAAQVAIVNGALLVEDSSKFLIALQSWAHKAYYPRPSMNLFRMRTYTEQTADFPTLSQIFYNFQFDFVIFN